MIGTVPGIVLGIAAILFGAWGFLPGGYPFLKLRGQGGGASVVIGFVALLMGLAMIGLSIWGQGLMGRR